MFNLCKQSGYRIRRKKPWAGSSKRHGRQYDLHLSIIELPTASRLSRELYLNTGIRVSRWTTSRRLH
ncbi:hypothetical protein TNCV_1794551 [Trichonephila clavipes]|nr:hypothetical protein TNCV_1794551 [Trichonephila clavipes]